MTGTTTAPTTLRLACGHDVDHEIGTPIFNYYDHRAGRIDRLADRPEPDTSGRLPNGEAWWVGTTAGMLDGSRMICQPCAVKRGWLDEIERQIGSSIERRAIADRNKRRRADYRLGWNAYQRGNPEALERADDRGVTRDWYDGFFDAASDRPKFHTLTCRTCDEFDH